MKQAREMKPRQLRRALERQARKAERKAGFPTQPQPAPTTVAAANADASTDHSPLNTDHSPSTKPVSEAKVAANAGNAAKSHGALTPETKAISAQNHTIHGLARHDNANFKILTSESANAFQVLKLSLIQEHEPSTKTECILVDDMAQSRWLAQRALRLQDTCLDSDTGEVADSAKFNLYMRYQTTHTRAFHRSLNDLLKLRKETRQAKLGVEAQELKVEAQRVESEKHEMKKELFKWEELRKDALACQQINILTNLRVEATKQNPNFMAEYQAELARRGFKVDGQNVAYRAA